MPYRWNVKGKQKTMAHPRGFQRGLYPSNPGQMMVSLLEHGRLLRKIDLLIALAVRFTYPEILKILA